MPRPCFHANRRGRDEVRTTDGRGFFVIPDVRNKAPDKELHQAVIEILEGNPSRRDVEEEFCQWVITHKYRGSRVAFTISKSVEPNEELKVG